ncbi:hypothetical protein PDIG_53100 [Penicillium digitatum PHI26]|uniref:Uncharacterized protein n=2 Tax=Penicillium digitatum TaxID=36651 RepID=K9FRG1_PEND2|nr:hypothetical protein PDIP_48320 [Penicillium digitatum Pd1]EKV10992.1 hypothetical protein PDIG_53100 [Penicillium digitatum PHI26]EKV13339.1 hypothetical protein PDIP_48320 [Penicillium digitatum Pd1]
MCWARIKQSHPLRRLRSIRLSDSADVQRQIEKSRQLFLVHAQSKIAPQSLDGARIIRLCRMKWSVFGIQGRRRCASPSISTICTRCTRASTV